MIRRNGLFLFALVVFALAFTTIFQNGEDAVERQQQQQQQIQQQQTSGNLRAPPTPLQQQGYRSNHAEDPADHTRVTRPFVGGNMHHANRNPNIWKDGSASDESDTATLPPISVAGSGRMANPNIAYRTVGGTPPPRYLKTVLRDDIPDDAIRFDSAPGIDTRTLKPVESEEESRRRFNDSRPLKVYVVSHRRSGTHLAGMALANSFRNVIIEYVLDHPPCDDLHLGCELFEQMKRSGKIIHAARDPRDIMVSFYYFVRRISQKTKPFRMSFSEFLQEEKFEHAVRGYQFDETVHIQRAEYLLYHLESWYAQDKDILHVEFDDLLNNLEPTLRRMSVFLERPYHLVSHEEWNTNQTRPVSFRKGVSGDWVNEFSQEDVEFVTKLWSTRPRFPIPYLRCASKDDSDSDSDHSPASVARSSSSSESS